MTNRSLHIIPSGCQTLRWKPTGSRVCTLSATLNPSPAGRIEITKRQPVSPAQRHRRGHLKVMPGGPLLASSMTISSCHHHLRQKVASNNLNNNSSGSRGLIQALKNQRLARQPAHNGTAAHGTLNRTPNNREAPSPKRSNHPGPRRLVDVDFLKTEQVDVAIA